jgi:hypothetical protein
MEVVMGGIGGRRGKWVKSLKCVWPVTRFILLSHQNVGEWIMLRWAFEGYDGVVCLTIGTGGELL